MYGCSSILYAFAGIERRRCVCEFQRYHKHVHDVYPQLGVRASIHDIMQVGAMVTCIYLDAAVTVAAKPDSHAQLQLLSQSMTVLLAAQGIVHACRDLRERR